MRILLRAIIKNTTGVHWLTPLRFTCLQDPNRGVDGGAAGNATEMGSSGEEDGAPDFATSTGGFAEYDDVPNTFVDDGYEETDATFDAEGVNRTIGDLPNNNAVTAGNMQPILRTVSANEC